MATLPPLYIAAGVAGLGIGSGIGFMKRGEESENMGESSFRQVTNGISGGVTYGLGGTAIGIGTAGTAMAIRKILGK